MVGPRKENERFEERRTEQQRGEYSRAVLLLLLFIDVVSRWDSGWLEVDEENCEYPTVKLKTFIWWWFHSRTLSIIVNPVCLAFRVGRSPVRASGRRIRLQPANQ